MGNLFKFLIQLLLLTSASAFSMSMSKTIYEIPNSGWTSPKLNWGYAAGTGHDCAAICRMNYSTRQSRQKLVDDLINAPEKSIEERVPQNFEEVKLVLALAWQRGRWDGSDGGRGGYGEVLAKMAEANRYEQGSIEDCNKRLTQDMQARFRLLSPNPEDLQNMETIVDEIENDSDSACRKCSGLVLKAMGFIENGL